MNIIIRSIVALATVLSVMLMPTATAAEADPGCADPSSYSNPVALCTPLRPRAVLIIEGNTRDWNLREFAQHVASETGLGVSSTPISSRQNVTITVQRFNDPTRSAGETVQTGVDSFVVRLNSAYDTQPSHYKRTVAAHEIGHVMGFNHHGGSPGIMTSPMAQSDSPSFNKDEWGHVCSWYGCSADIVNKYW